MSSTEQFPLATPVLRDPEQVFGDIDGRVVMLNITNGEYYQLNAVGSRIWTLLEQTQTGHTLVEQLSSEFEVDRPTCETEVAEFLATLDRDGLLKRA